MTPAGPGSAGAGIDPDEYDDARGGEARGERYARMLHPLFSGAPGVTVDVGGGTGIVARHLAALGHRVVCVDRTPPMARKAAGRLPGRVVVGDATRLPLRAGAAVDACSVWLMHLVDPAAVLAEVARVLRPGGRYLVVPTDRGGDHPVRRLTQEMSRRLAEAGWARHPDADGIVQAAAGLPFRHVQTAAGPPHAFTTTPREAAELLERRRWFLVASVPDDLWADVVAPTIEAIRALPAQDEVVSYEVVPSVVVLERTA